jgi:invasion protein IalB
MSVSARTYIASSLAIMVAATLALPALAQQASLPGGASTLSETHGGWTVTCAIGTQAESGPVKYCALSQTQLHSQTRQRALAIELHPEGDGVQGTLLLPFGLSLPSGVSYQLDEGETGPAQLFRTCLPAGCLVDIAFDARMVESLKTGSAMKVEASADGGERMVFSISLEGFTSAYDRVRALME